jgi:hypothetical protein
MKATLTFTLPEEQEEFELAQNGWKYKGQVEEIWQKVFRPYHKHGYGDQEIDALLENDDCRKLFNFLEARYREAINVYED